MLPLKRTEEAWVWSLTGELRPSMLCSETKKQNPPLPPPTKIHQILISAASQRQSRTMNTEKFGISYLGLWAWLLKSLRHIRLCDPMDLSLPVSSVHGILQARILEWLPCPPPDLLDPGKETASLKSPALAGKFFTTSATWNACCYACSCQFLLLPLLLFLLLQRSTAQWYC